MRRKGGPQDRIRLYFPFFFFYLPNMYCPLTENMKVLHRRGLRCGESYTKIGASEFSGKPGAGATDRNAE